MGTFWMGGLLVAAYLAVAGEYVRRKRAPNALWVCHVGTLMLGLGLLSGQAHVEGAGVLLVAVGVPFWVVYLLLGGELVWPSVASHLGGLAVAGASVGTPGVVSGCWHIAFLVTLGLHGACRVVSSREDNVNLGVVVWDAFETSAWRRLVVRLAAAALVALTFWSMEHGVQLALGRPGGTP